MRLIDADKLLERIGEITSTDMMKVLVEDWINSEPTAYDLDKVVEQLEAQSEMNLKKGLIEVLPDEARPYLKAVESFDKAIEIVKAGGLNE